MKANPYDPRKRTNLTENEQRALRFMDECLHGDNFDLIVEYVAEDYIQHTPHVNRKENLIVNEESFKMGNDGRITL